MHRTPRLAYLAFSALAAGLLGSPARAGEKQPKTPPPGGEAQLKQLGDELIKGLKATPGCLGVDSGQMSSGKAVIFAFFENKKAAMKWYYSPTHQKAMDLLNPDRDRKHVPMRGVPDDVPVMAVAAITFGGKPAAGRLKLPVSQISIELYTPLSGGLNVGGGFSPDAFRALRRAPRGKPDRE